MHDGPGINADFPIFHLIQDGYEDKVELYFSEKRQNCYGHDLRARAIEVCDTEFLMFQNADNYIIPSAIQILESAIIADKPDLLLFNCLHNYAGHLWGNPDYVVLDVKPQINYCDIGSFVIRTCLAKRVGFNHRVSHADGLFIEEVMSTNPAARKINHSVLMVHN